MNDKRIDELLTKLRTELEDANNFQYHRQHPVVITGKTPCKDGWLAVPERGPVVVWTIYLSLHPDEDKLPVVDRG